MRGATSREIPAKSAVLILACIVLLESIMERVLTNMPSDAEQPVLQKSAIAPTQQHWWHFESETWENILIVGVGIFLTAAVMVLPLWLISRMHLGTLGAAAAGVGTAGVGISAIFRSVSRDILRTSIGVVSRTAARAVSRHWTHLVIQWLSHTLFNRKYQHSGDGTPHPILAIVMGSVTLILSYGAILWLVSPAIRGEILGDMSIYTAAISVAIPLFSYYIIAYLAGRSLGVRVIPRTELDGILLQVYFTFALSFLPLTSDGEYRGDSKRCAWVAGIAIGGLFVLHLLLSLMGSLMGLPVLTHLAVLFLIQAFVLSFPFRPLDGQRIWQQSKLIWFLSWLPIAIAFHLQIPSIFYELM